MAKIRAAAQDGVEHVSTEDLGWITDNTEQCFHDVLFVKGDRDGAWPDRNGDRGDFMACLVALIELYFWRMSPVHADEDHDDSNPEPDGSRLPNS